MKRGTIIVIVIAAIIALAAAWYLISPAFISIERDEPSPVFLDDLEAMSDEKKAEFDVAVAQAQANTSEILIDMPSAATTLKEADFKERAHEVEGKAILIEQDGKQILRFENFETINGPNLHIYLSSDLGSGDYIDLGKIKATKGNINYEVPEGTDLSKYNKVLVWCVPFRVLFSYADLS